MALISVCGRLGQDPELLELAGLPACKFSVAESVRRKVRGQWENVTQWWSVIVWRAPAEWLARDGSKGDWIYVEGEVQLQTWEQDGQKRQRTEISASRYQLCGPSKRAEQPRRNEPSRAPQRGSADDAIPF